MAVSFANDEQWSRALSSHNNKFGNYFIEAGRSFGAIKDFNLKLQSSKQLKNQYAKNDFMELRGNVLGINTVYSRKSSQTASATSSNSTVDKTLGLNYRFENGLSLGFNTKQTRTATLTSAEPTINRQLSYNVRWDRKKYRLNYTSTATTNYNQASGAISKNTQSALIIGVPINDLLEVNLRLQSNGTNNSAPGSASTFGRQVHESSRPLLPPQQQNGFHLQQDSHG